MAVELAGTWLLGLPGESYMRSELSEPTLSLEAENWPTCRLPGTPEPTATGGDASSRGTEAPARRYGGLGFGCVEPGPSEAPQVELAESTLALISALWSLASLFSRAAAAISEVAFLLVPYKSAKFLAGGLVKDGFDVLTEPTEVGRPRK